MAAIVGTLVLAWAGWFYWNASQVRRIEAEIRTRGEPLTLAELADTYSAIPDDENAAVPLLDAWEKEQPAYWRAIRAGNRSQVPLAEPTFDPNLPYLGKNARAVPRGNLEASNWIAAESYLNARKEHMAVVRSAIRRHHARFPIKLQDGFGALLPHLGKLKSEAQSFQIEALVASENGRTAQALGAIESIKGLADTLDEESFFVGQLARGRCLQMGLDAAEQLMSRQKLNATELDRLIALLQEMPLTNALHRSFIGERCCSLSVFTLSPYQMSLLLGDPGQSAEEIREQAQGTQIMRWLFGLTGIRTADRRLMLEAMTQAVTLADRDLSEAWVDYERLGREMEAELERFPPRLFSKMLLPSFNKVGTRFASFEARRRSAVVACLVEKHRHSHGGELPQSVEALVSNSVVLAKDPFTGELLRMRSLPSGFAVYSVGPDRKDDNARQRIGNEKSDYDETFIVEQ